MIQGAMRGIRLVHVSAFVLWASATLAPAQAEEPPQAPPAAEAAPVVADEYPEGVTPGPATIDLGHDLTLDLGEPYVFAEKALAARMLEASGSFHHESLLGVVAPKAEDAQWFVVVDYDGEGYVKEDEEIDADDLLETIRDGLKRQNEERAEKGFQPLEIQGWAEPPRHDPARHHLVWGLDVAGSNGVSVNYNTRALGRKGYVSMVLVTEKSLLAQDKPEVEALLASTRFDEGSRYEDYQPGDKVAEYGLAGLVLAGAGLAAVKIAKAGFFVAFLKPILVALLAAKKAVIVGLIALAALLRKIFGGREPATPSGPPPGVPPPLPPTA
jgi:uncharacterized membrane-anchored protein